ncbi:class I SAM-dependent methyltransferase [Allohahella marinimesophila]|uniref:Methyltransferase domain-containing protein n=1 Tax=Allohahella marinimesophila TaxID=1054972 RepID=A0ABP7NFL7_9GAMM
MSFYENRILPHVIHLTCGAPAVMHQRQLIVPQATGRVLEIGMGSGLNIPLYDPTRVTKVWGLEPSEGMRRKAAAQVAAAPFELEWLELPGEEIPLDSKSVDSIVLTYTLCTIPDWRQVLKQMRRVLKPGGQLLFSEHGKAPDAAVARWQSVVDPLWGKLAGGCSIKRDIPGLLREGGFSISGMDEGYLPMIPKFAAYNYAGRAS